MVVDGAEVVLAEKLAAAGDVGEDELRAHSPAAVAEGGGGGEGAKAADLVAGERRGEGVAVLFAAGGCAMVPGCGAEDGKAEGLGEGLV